MIIVCNDGSGLQITQGDDLVYVSKKNAEALAKAIADVRVGKERIVRIPEREYKR